MPALAKDEVERLIRQTAQEMGAGDLADVLVATAIAENGLSNTNPGDMGKDGQYHSFGPFHENDGGRGYGLTREQREDVPAATRRAVAEFKAMQKKYPGVDPGSLAVFAQRPAESARPGYVKRINDLVSGGSGGTPQQGGAGRGGLPQAVLLDRGGGREALPQAVLVSGDSGLGSVGGAAQAGGSAWPLPNGTVSNKFGGPQGRSPGMKGTLPSSNVGVDVAGVPEGGPVVAPVSGEVVKVHQSQGVGNADENGGWGGMVLIKGRDGYFHRLSHLQQGSVGVKAGDAVQAGQPVAKVGATGNTMAGGKGPFVHLDWEKFQTKTGNPDDRGTMTFADPTTAGTEGAAGARGGNTVAVLKASDIPQEKVDKDPDVADRKKRLDEQQAKADQYLEDFNAAGRAMQALREKYADPATGKPLDKGPLDAADKIDMNLRRRPRGNLPKVDRWWEIPGYSEENPAWAADKAAWQAHSRTYNDLDDKKEGKGKEWDDALALAKTFNSDYLKAQQDSRERFAKESKDAADTTKPTYQIDSESGTVLENGKPIASLPRDAKPGATFSVPGVGTFIVNADGTGATLIAGTKPVPDYAPGSGQRTVDTFDPDGKPVTVLIGADGRIIQRFPRQPSAADRNRTRLVETFDKSGAPITALVDDDQGGKIISEYPRESKEQPITAPRDTKFIVRRGQDGKLIAEDNPNYDPTTGSVTGTSSTGQVYRVGADGKATITDVLTPEERAAYQRGKLADTTKTEADALTGILKVATDLNTAELDRQKATLWNSVRKIIADPNSGPDQILGAIQAGAKDAEEWTKILDAHVRQKTQEEVGRHNRIEEGVSIQNADSRTREGLYKDVNDTRNQRQLAQGRSNEAIAQSGIIGEANSMNVLSAMAPQVGSDGIRRAGTIGLGVGAGAIEPVEKTWEEHQAELKKLMDQMPAIRMAQKDTSPTPSFALPKPTGATIDVQPAGRPGDDLIKTVTDRIKGLGAAPAVAAAVPPPPAAPTPAPFVPPPPPPPEPPKEEEDFSSTSGAGIGLGGGYRASKSSPSSPLSPAKFRVPQPRKKKVAA